MYKQKKKNIIFIFQIVSSLYYFCKTSKYKRRSYMNGHNHGAQPSRAIDRQGEKQDFEA